MTTNEMAVAAKTDNDKTMELWERCEGVSKRIARKFMNAMPKDHQTADAEDFSQTAFLTMMEAVQDYDPEANTSCAAFSTFFHQYLNKRYAELSGLTEDALNKCVSMAQKVMTHDGLQDELTLEDTIKAPDESLIDPVEEVYKDQLKKQMDKCVGKLSQEQREIIRAKFVDELSEVELADKWNVSLNRVRQIENAALGILRKPEIGMVLEQYVNERTGFYQHTSLARFKTTHESVVETLVLKRERISRIAANQWLSGDKSRKNREKIRVLRAEQPEATDIGQDQETDQTTPETLDLGPGIHTGESTLGSFGIREKLLSALGQSGIIGEAAETTEPQAAS